MTKTELYNLARDEFNLPHVTDEVLDSDGTRETRIFDMRLNQAVSRVCTELDWSWLDNVVDFTDSDDKGPRAGYAHSYPLPSSISRVTNVPSSRYRLVGGMVLTDFPIGYVVGQQMSSLLDFTDTNPPYEWWMLVVYALAWFSCPSLTNNDQKMYSLIQTKYANALNTLAMSDAHHATNRRTTDAF